MTTTAQKKAQTKYDKTHTRSVLFKLNLTTDADILAKLDDVENRQGYIKQLIRRDIRGDQSVLSIEAMSYLLRPLAIKHRLKAVYLFGSYARGEARPESDVDLVIEGGSIHSADEYFSLVDQIETALGKKADLLQAETVFEDTSRAGKRLINHIEKEKVVLYESI